MKKKKKRHLLLQNLPKDRRKAPCFSYGDIRRALSCVMWGFAV